MSNPFFDRPVLNSPYAAPTRHWELDEQGQPTQRILETRRRADFVSPIPKPRKRRGNPFDKPKSGRIAVKVIDHLGDEVMKVFKV